MITSARKGDKESFSIAFTLRGKAPALPFERIKTKILGKSYSLSLAFIGDKKSQTLNRIYRNKNKPANVLSFPLSKTAGEIFINPRLAKKEAKKFGMAEKKFLIYLFIHGILHLKGHNHGSTMDKLEQKYLKQFSF